MAAPSTEGRLLAVGRITGKRRTLITALPLDQIEPNPEQPRRFFDEQALGELAESIRQRGVLQPIIVRARPGERFLLVAGERRFRAAKLAGQTAIPALVTDGDPLEIAMVENIQREDLTPLETARGMAELIREHGFTHADVAALIHKSRPYVSNSLALLRLPETIQEEYDADPTIPRDILISVAREKDEAAMEASWRNVKLKRLSVRKFRKENAPERDAEPATRQVINTARKLGRRLGDLPEDMPEELEAKLARTLKRLRKKIDGFLEGR